MLITKKYRIIYSTVNVSFVLRCSRNVLTCPCNVDPLHPLLFSKTEVYKGIHFSYFCSKT